MSNPRAGGISGLHAARGRGALAPALMGFEAYGRENLMGGFLDRCWANPMDALALVLLFVLCVYLAPEVARVVKLGWKERRR